MKITFALASFFPSHQAGTEIYVLNLARFLRLNGCDVSIIISKIAEETTMYWFDNFPVYCVPIIEKPKKEELIGEIAPSGLPKFMQILQKINPTIVHFHSFNRAINSWNLKATKENGYKTVFTAHLGGLFCFRGDFLYNGQVKCDGKIIESKCLSCILDQRKIPFPSIVSTLYLKFGAVNFLNQYFPSTFKVIKNKLNELERINNYSDRIISISEWIENAYMCNGIKNAVLVKQGIDTSKFTKLQKTNDSETIKITFVGRMHPFKGIHLLTDALLQINNPKFVLQIITIKHDVDYYKQIQTSANKLAHKEWFENLSPDEVSARMCNTDILCLPSLSNEASPLVILEAFAKGIPVVGSDYPAIKDAIQDEVDGLLFENGNVQSLVSVLKRILEEPNLLQNLTNNVQKPRGIEEVGMEMLSIYNAL